MDSVTHVANSVIDLAIQVKRGLVADLAVVPVLKVLTMIALGAILAQPRVAIINPESSKVLSKLVFAVFLPCLIFTELGAQVTVHNMVEWWFIPANVIVATAIGYLIGNVVALVCRTPRYYYRFTVVMTAMGNTGNIPLAIVSSICHTKTNPFGSTCKSAGVAYVSFATWISVIIMYTFVYHMLEPPEYEEGILVSRHTEQEVEPREVENGSEVVDEEEVYVRPTEEEEHPVFLETDWPGLSDAYNVDEHQVPFLRRMWRPGSQASVLSANSEDEEFRRVSCLKEPKVVRRIRNVAERTPLQRIFQPPIVASILAIVVNLIPGSKGLLFGEDAPLGFLNDSLDILAAAMVPCILLVLGGAMAVGPAKSELGISTIIGICVSRLFVLPMVGIGVIALADFLGILPEGDGMFKFVLFVQYAMPSAILCGAMASLRGYGPREAASLLFWQHIVAGISVSLAIFLYIRYLDYIT